MTCLRAVVVGALLALTACSGSSTAGGSARAPDFVSPGTKAQQPGGPCRAAPAARVLFLALEASPDELDGLRYFVDDWGTRLGCFAGTVATDVGALAGAAYDVLVVDVSHDRAVSSQESAGVHASAAAGKPLILFVQPGRLVGNVVDPGAVSALADLFGGLRLTRTCANSSFTAALTMPFTLVGGSLHYESFFQGVFDVVPGQASTPIATDQCGAGAPTIARVGHRVAAGFYIANAVSMADDTAAAVTIKEMVVDLIDSVQGT